MWKVVIDDFFGHMTWFSFERKNVHRDVSRGIDLNDPCLLVMNEDIDPSWMSSLSSFTSIDRYCFDFRGKFIRYIDSIPTSSNVTLSFSVNTFVVRRNTVKCIILSCDIRL